MTLAQAKVMVRQTGATLKSIPETGEFRVSWGSEESAYYTDDLQDAVDTALFEYRRKRQQNPGTGKAFTFHGSFTSKLAAKRKEAQTPGSFIETRGGRYYVLKPRRLRNVRVRRTIRNVASSVRSRTVRRSTHAKRNPGKGTLIYKSITRVEGTKGLNSLYPGKKFYHRFKKPYPSMYGLPDGSLLIK